MAIEIYTGIAVDTLSEMTMDLARKTNAPTIYCKENDAYYVRDISQPNGWRDRKVMRRPVYDTNDSGVVDNSERLGGQLPGYYAKASDIQKSFIAGGTAVSNAILIAGGTVDLTITYDAPLPALTGKTAADTRVIPLVTSSPTASLLGSLSVSVKSRTLSGCVVTLKNSGLLSAALGVVVEAIAFETGTPA